MSAIRTETEAGVRSIVFARPDEYNTITPAFRDELAAAIERLGATVDVQTGHASSTLSLTVRKDNLAAALHGGFTVAWVEADGRARHAREARDVLHPRRPSIGERGVGAAGVAGYSCH